MEQDGKTADGDTVTTAPAEDVPRYFHDYALENERQHTNLGDLIDQARINLSGRLDGVIRELRIIKATSLGIFGTVLVAASKYVFGW